MRQRTIACVSTCLYDGSEANGFNARAATLIHAVARAVSLVLQCAHNVSLPLRVHCAHLFALRMLIFAIEL